MIQGLGKVNGYPLTERLSYLLNNRYEVVSAEYVIRYYNEWYNNIKHVAIYLYIYIYIRIIKNYTLLTVFTHEEILEIVRKPQ
jgi:hypothetical protein